MLPGQELTFDSVLNLLRRRRWLLIVPAFLGVMGGLLYSRSQPSLYRSDAVIQVVPQRVPEAYVSATVTERVEDRLRALAQQVLSRTQLEKLITDFDLFPEERKQYPLEDVVILMTKRILIEPLATAQTSRREAQSEAFRVSFDYRDPATAQKVVEKLASFFIDTNAQERGNQAQATTLFLENQLNDARTRLQEQERKVAVFRERNSGRLPTQMQTNMQAIQNTQMALQAMVESLARDRDRKLMLERLYADAVAEVEAMTASGGAPAGSSGAAPGTLPANATPQQRLEAARSLLTQLETRLSAKHPDVVRTKRMVEDLEKQVAAENAQRPVSPDSAQAGPPASAEEARKRDNLRETRAQIESLERQIAFKEGEEKRLRAQVGEYQTRLEAVPGIESEWIALTRDYDTLQATYRDLLAKSENSKMAENLESRAIGEQFRILDPARVPLKPNSPNRIRINAIGTLAGIGVGLLLLGMSWYRDTTMRSEAEVVSAIDLPVLVVLPYVATKEDQGRQTRRRAWMAMAVTATLVVTAALAWVLRLWKFVV